MDVGGLPRDCSDFIFVSNASMCSATYPYAMQNMNGRATTNHDARIDPEVGLTMEVRKRAAYYTHFTVVFRDY